MKERKINILKEDLKIRKDGKEVFIKTQISTGFVSNPSQASPNQREA